MNYVQEFLGHRGISIRPSEPLDAPDSGSDIFGYAHGGRICGPRGEFDLRGVNCAEIHYGWDRQRDFLAC